ncbi:phosphopantetheine-binding protein [Geminicoccus harenae]|uniref:phosphopantetheine-binding protein n=1 Tax=Geminicoccus harenae TaxID=2498453 RepID=UPI001C9779B7|nr:phosphopantetheine-binding protein [Geminicoccus harenae]
MGEERARSAAELTLESMRREIAALLHDDPEEIGTDDSLIDLGLDSMRAMALVRRWQEIGVRAEFSAFAATPTLAHWWDVVQRSRG